MEYSLAQEFCEWCRIRVRGCGRSPAVLVAKHKSGIRLALCGDCSALGMFADDKVVMRYGKNMTVTINDEKVFPSGDTEFKEISGGIVTIGSESAGDNGY